MWIDSNQDRFLLDAIRNNNEEDIKILLSQNKEIVHKLGWHGLRPLHIACLSGNVSITLTLLKYGANPNVKNDAGETPLHLACIHCDPSMLISLIKNKGDVLQLDNLDQSCIHHCCKAGTVEILHYLHIVHGLDLMVPNKYGHTPVHIAAFHQRANILKFLLKRKECDANQIDKEGNTALHIAAANGFIIGCWILFKVCGTVILNQANNSGKLPIHLALEGSTPNHKETVKWLKIWNKSSILNHGNVLTLKWYLRLTFPIIWFITTTQIAGQLFPFQEAFFTVPSLITFVLIAARKEKYKLDHPNRDQNPLFAGIFIGGILLSILCYFFHLKALQNSPLLLTVFILPCGAIMLWYLCLLLFLDPGTVTESSVHFNEYYNLSVKWTLHIEERTFSFCQECELFLNNASRHCSLCKKCFYAMDHHCAFFLRCIASNNHHCFIIFISCLLISSILFLINIMILFSSFYPAKSWISVGLIILLEDTWTFSVLVGAVCAGVWSSLVLYSQLQRIAHQEVPLMLDVGRFSAQLVLKQKLHNIWMFFVQKKDLRQNCELKQLKMFAHHYDM